MIDNYESGRMTVRGEVHQRDLKIIDGRVVAGWWRRSDHNLVSEDVRDILDARPDVMVVGTGYAGNMRVDDSLPSAADKRKIRLIARKTPEAVNRFNELWEKGERVAGAFHLTC